jgi:hypothetical protein
VVGVEAEVVGSKLLNAGQNVLLEIFFGELLNMVARWFKIKPIFRI